MADLTRRQLADFGTTCGGAAHPADFVTTLARAAEYLNRRETLPALILTGIDTR